MVETKLPPQSDRGLPAYASRYCRACRYSLIGLIAPRCPECRQSFDLNNPSTYAESPRRPFFSRQMMKALFIGGALMPVELLAGLFAYHTIGEVDSALMIFFLFAANFLVALTVICRTHRLTLAAFLGIALLIIPYQCWLGVRYAMLGYEAQCIAAYCEQVKVNTGESPTDLSGYSLAFESSRDHI